MCWHSFAFKRHRKRYEMLEKLKTPLGFLDHHFERPHILVSAPLFAQFHSRGFDAGRSPRSTIVSKADADRSSIVKAPCVRDLVSGVGCGRHPLEKAALV